MPSTPHLVVDADVLEANIARMARVGVDAGVALRPHVKTHKIPEIAALQHDAGAQGLTVATVGEAEVFAEAGFDDLFIAYPLWLDADAGRRLVRVADRARIAVGCDSLEAAKNLLRVAGRDYDVLVELDSGQHRSGVSPTNAGELAAGIAGLGFTVRGAFTFPGHSYSRETRADAAQHERDALAMAARMMRTRGVTPDVLSGGSSPSMAYLSTSSGQTDDAPTEMRPGAYVFNDAQQWDLGVCGPEDIALTAHATVVSHAGGRLVLNAGSKTLGADKAAWAQGYGRLLDHPDARITQLSEHHAVVGLGDEALPPLGSTVRVVPNHCCNAVNLADEVSVERDGVVIDTWAVAARGRNA